jgi:hypothetical protein
LITRPESADAPVTAPKTTVAVQTNIVFGTEEVRTMFVDWPEQMVLDRESFVTMGLAVTESNTVSAPVQPSSLATAALINPPVLVVIVWVVPRFWPVVRLVHWYVHPAQYPASKFMESPAQMVRSGPRAGIGEGETSKLTRVVSVRLS